MDEVVVRGAADDAEEGAVLDLLPRVMGAPREFFAARYHHDPYGSAEHSRIVLSGGEIVSHVRVYRRPIRLGRGEVWTGAIGDVCTLPQYRRRGYAAMALRDAAAWMLAQGIPLCTILSGVGVYERVGWEKVPEPHFTFAAAGLRGLIVPAEVTVRRLARVGDEATMMAAYAAHAEGRSLTVVRSPPYWRHHVDMALVERADACLLAERAGRPVAYVRCGGEAPTLSILEAPYIRGEAGACAVLADALGRLAAKRGITAFKGYLPPDHPWVAMGACVAASTEHLLVKVLDLPAVLAAGLEGTVPAAGAVAWVVRCGGQEAVVRPAGEQWSVDGGDPAGAGATVLECSQAALMRVLFRQVAPSVAWGGEWAWLDEGMVAPAPVYWRTDGV